MNRMKTIMLAVTRAFFCVKGLAQSEQDRKAIRDMCGCYSIKFDYAETFSQDTAYELHDQYHAETPAEWVFVDAETKGKIVIQHLLVINDTIIIKHWRQDWLYQNQDLYWFKGDLKWKYDQYSNDDVVGQWTQKVYQVDDSPRYQGSASWVHVDRKYFWENTTDAPLPRREYSKRSDYNIMQRTNRLILTDDGWLHDQDNLNIFRENGFDKIIVAEKGLNVCTKLDDSKCSGGQTWWEENKTYWRLVRAEWDEVFAQHQDIAITKKMDNKMLWQALFVCGAESQKKSLTKPKKVSKEIAAIIESFVTVTPLKGSLE